MSQPPIALYTEFHNEQKSDGKIMQMLFYPGLYLAARNQTVPAGVISRSISNAHPNRNWRPIPRNTVETDQAAPSLDIRLNSQGGIVRDYGLEEAMTFAASSLLYLHSILSAMQAQRYRLAGHPIPVELSQEDIQALVTLRSPLGVIQRIPDIRQVYAELAKVPLPVVEAA